MLVEPSVQATTDKRLRKTDLELLSLLIDLICNDENEVRHTQKHLIKTLGWSYSKFEPALRRLCNAGYVHKPKPHVLKIDPSAIFDESIIDGSTTEMYIPYIDNTCPVILEKDSKISWKYWRITHWPSVSYEGRWCVAEQYRGSWRMMIDDLDEDRAELIASCIHEMSLCQGYAPAWYGMKYLIFPQKQAAAS